MHRCESNRWLLNRNRIVRRVKMNTSSDFTVEFLRKWMLKLASFSLWHLTIVHGDSHCLHVKFQQWNLYFMSRLQPALPRCQPSPERSGDFHAVSNTSDCGNLLLRSLYAKGKLHTQLYGHFPRFMSERGLIFQIGDCCFHETLRVEGIQKNFSSSALLLPLTIIPTLCLCLSLRGRKHPWETEELQNLASWNYPSLLLVYNNVYLSLNWRHKWSFLFFLDGIIHTTEIQYMWL